MDRSHEPARKAGGSKLHSPGCPQPPRAQPRTFFSVGTILSDGNRAGSGGFATRFKYGPPKMGVYFLLLPTGSNPSLMGTQGTGMPTPKPLDLEVLRRSSVAPGADHAAARCR